MNADTRTAAAAQAPPDALPADNARHQRKKAMTDTRRELVLAAARAAFFELGLEGASLREIAKRAGYTPGALYSYFSSKEDVYAALLGESLERLNLCVAQALAQATEGDQLDEKSGRGVAPEQARAHTQAVAQLRASATAFFEFYRDNPRDLDLGFYLFQGMQPRGLTPALNKQLNARLRDALAPTQNALVAMGWTADDALTDTTALFAHTVGLLVVSHTGRMRMFRRTADELFARHLASLTQR